MSKQTYPDLTKLRIVYHSYCKTYADVLVLFKKGAQYSLCDVKGKNVFHATEKSLAEMIARAEIYRTPLYKALE